MGLAPGGIAEMFTSDTSHLPKNSALATIYKDKGVIDAIPAYLLSGAGKEGGKGTGASILNTIKIISAVARQWLVPSPPSNPRYESAILKQRKGFIKLALETSAPVTPVYCFGGSILFREVKLPLLAWLSRRIRASLIALYGSGFLPIPFQVPLVYAIGKSIYPGPTPCPNPSSEEIDFLHNTFINSIRILFEQHKGEYGWEGKVLKVI